MSARPADVPRYSNMTDEEAERWERSGGSWQPGASMRGVVYHEPEPAPPKPPKPPKEPRARRTAAQIEASDFAPSAHETQLRLDRVRERLEQEAVRREVREAVEQEERRQAAIPKEPAPEQRYERPLGDVPSSRQLQRAGQIVRNVGVPTISRYSTPAADALVSREALILVDGPAVTEPWPMREPWHGTLAGYTEHGCRCLDCVNAANEAAMLGTYKPRA